MMNIYRCFQHMKLLISYEVGSFFKLNNVVPWGRNMEEYKTMFLLSEDDMISKVIDEYKEKYDVELKETDYEFQKNANKILVIRK